MNVLVCWFRRSALGLVLFQICLVSDLSCFRFVLFQICLVSDLSCFRFVLFQICLVSNLLFFNCISCMFLKTKKLLNCWVWAFSSFCCCCCTLSCKQWVSKAANAWFDCIDRTGQTDRIEEKKRKRKERKKERERQRQTDRQTDKWTSKAAWDQTRVRLVRPPTRPFQSRDKTRDYGPFWTRLERPQTKPH